MCIIIRFSGAFFVREVGKTYGPLPSDTTLAAAARLAAVSFSASVRGSCTNRPRLSS